MNKIRSFSGEFPRKIFYPDVSEPKSFEEELSFQGDESDREKIEKILTYLIESEFPYRDLNGAINMIVNLFQESKIDWKPSVWCEIEPGKFQRFVPTWESQDEYRR
jgi:hypothetical protein